MGEPESPKKTPLEGQLLCFQSFPIANKSATNSRKDRSFALTQIHLQGKFPEVELLGQKIRVFIMLIAMAKLPSIEVTHIYLPLRNMRVAVSSQFHY